MTWRRVGAVLPFAAMVMVAAVGAQGTERGGSAPAPTRFTVRIENVSNASTLKLSTGGAVAIPMSAVAWAVHSAANPMITPGKVDPGLGLKGLAEAGMAGAFAASLSGVAGVRSHGASGQPMLLPGSHFELTIEARPGDRLSLAMMIGQSNDGVIANGAEGIALFVASGRPVAGDVTAQLFNWDAGTEVNEGPGRGRNQGVRQGAPNAGDPERRPVRLMSEAEFGSLWPAVNKMVRVTLAPAPR